MEVSKEKLQEIAEKFSKVRIFRSADGTKYFKEDGAALVDEIGDCADIVRDNFEYFAKRTSSILYPDDFITVVKNIPGGRKLLADKLEYILKNFSHKHESARLELVGIPEVSERIAVDFEKFFNLSLYGQEEKETSNDGLTEEARNKLRYVNLCPSSMQTDFNIFLGMLMSAENPGEVLEKNKAIFLNSNFNTAILGMVNAISKNPKCHKFIQDNFESIKENCYGADIAKLYDSVRNICPNEFEKEAFIIDKIYFPAIENLNQSQSYITDSDCSLTQINTTCSEIIRQGKSKNVEELINYIMKANNTDEFSICGAGSFNTAIRVGDKIIKIAGMGERNTIIEDSFDIPYHPRLLLPIIRKRDMSSDKDHPIDITVLDGVDTDIEVSDEELLEIYKELRENGIRWLDVKKENVGRLKKDNKQYEVGANIPAPLEHLGIFDTGLDRKELKAGDLVIIDFNYLYYDRDEENLKFVTAGVPRCVLEYEKKYLAKKEENGKKLVKKPEKPNPHDEH